VSVAEVDESALTRSLRVLAYEFFGEPTIGAGGTDSATDAIWAILNVIDRRAP